MPFLYRGEPHSLIPHFFLGSGNTMNKSDVDVAAPLIVQYYEWLSGHGGCRPDLLLSLPLTPSQREQLLQGIEDVNLIWSITAPLRVAAPATSSGIASVQDLGCRNRVNGFMD